MTKNISEDMRDRIEAKLVAKNPAYKPSRPGPLTAIALTERDTRAHQFNGNLHSDSKAEDANSKQEQVFIQQLKTAMLRSAMSVSNPPTEQPTSIWNPAAQRNKKLEKEMGYKDMGDGACRPISFAAHAADHVSPLPVALQSSSSLSSFSLDPAKAAKATSFKQAADGVFATGSPLTNIPSLQVDLSNLTAPNGSSSVFSNGTDDIMPMTFDHPAPGKGVKGQFKKAAKPHSGTVPQPGLQLVPGSIGPVIDLNTEPRNAPNHDHFRLEA